MCMTYALWWFTASDSWMCVGVATLMHFGSFNLGVPKCGSYLLLLQMPQHKWPGIPQPAAQGLQMVRSLATPLLVLDCAAALHRLCSRQPQQPTRGPLLPGAGRSNHCKVGGSTQRRAARLLQSCLIGRRDTGLQLGLLSCLRFLT